MTSKEAITNIKVMLERTNNLVFYKEEIEAVKKDLEILEILKKHIYFSSKSGCIRMKDIYKSINNFDYEDLKDWLENEIHN